MVPKIKNNRVHAQLDQDHNVRGVRQNQSPSGHARVVRSDGGSAATGLQLARGGKNDEHVEGELGLKQPA